MIKLIALTLTLFLTHGCKGTTHENGAKYYPNKFWAKENVKIICNHQYKDSYGETQEFRYYSNEKEQFYFVYMLQADLSIIHSWIPESCLEKAPIKPTSSTLAPKFKYKQRVTILSNGFYKGRSAHIISYEPILLKSGWKVMYTLDDKNLPKYLESQLKIKR